MQNIIIEPHYLPCIEYFAVIDSFDQVILEYHENYIKQSYRNRCRIMTAQGVNELYVPVAKPSGKVMLKDVKIDYSQKWVKDHWRAIKTAYGSAPFFEHFGFMFEDIYLKKCNFLIDLNMEFLSLCSRLLKLNISFHQTSVYEVNLDPETADWRSRIHPKNPLKNNPFYKPCNYNQIFGNNFVGNLSIIDLLFCEGRSARQVVKNSKP